jgi:helicase MOV-10
VRKLEVGVRFNASFGEYSNKQIFNVRFKLNRYPMRRQHQALSTAFTPERILFPLVTHTQTPMGLATSFNAINPLIGTNPSQMHAVTAIINQKRGSVPFVVFGPSVVPSNSDDILAKPFVDLGLEKLSPSWKQFSNF